jgi:hypothetical protein
MYGAPEAAATMSDQTDHLRAVAALRIPEHQVRQASIDLGGRTVLITHPGGGTPATT